MKTLSKKSLVVLFSLITVLMFAVCATFVAESAKASETTTPPAITMVKGASARVGGDEVNGLRFIAGMSNEDYGWFANNVGEEKTYASVKFGMFIAPADYLVAGKEFTEANLFGESAIYDWATYQDGVWVYNGKNGEVVDGVKTPVRIINIVADEMSTYIDDPNLMVVTGAIKDYKEYNIVRDFVGRGYYQLFDGAGNVVKTELASYTESAVDNNTRSMIEVVQASIENEVLDEDQITSATSTYFDPIKDNVSAKNDRIDVLLNKTVAGNDYNGAKSAVDVTTVVYTSAAGNKTEFKLNSWGTQSVALNVNDGVVTAKDVCGGALVTSKYLGLTVTADAYMPISSRADLDALGFDYVADQTVNHWGAGNRYMLTNDIDYATDTSVYTTAKGETFRMDDGNGTQDLWDRYLIPIAASYTDYQNTASRSRVGTYEWGIFGEIGKDGKFFYGIIDGAGYAIKNAVVPYGTIFAYGDINTNHGQNFIGSLVYGGQLRNIAFTGLEFEDPLQIGSAAGQNPYYTDTNTKVANTKLKTNGYITGSTILPGKANSVNYGQYLAMNASNRTGLVGAMQNAVISNVYVDAAIKSGTYGLNAKNGLLVAHIDVDYSADGVNPYGGTYTIIENCITKTSYAVSNVNYFGDAGGAINAGMATMVGYSAVSAESIRNCFTIGNLKLASEPGGATTCTTIFTPNSKMFANTKNSTNCGVYASVSALQDAQASVLANMSIAKYLG